MSSKNRIYTLVLTAMFLSLSLVLPFLTGQIPKIGSMLCPMHLPVLLCGYFCGPFSALLTGFAAPLLRFLIFGMPPVFPTGIGMSFELAAYGAAAGLLYRILPKTKLNIYVSLIAAQLAGRAVWGIVRVILFGLAGSSFGWAAFLSGAFLNAIPGILVQLILIPVLVMTLEKTMRNESPQG